MDYYNQTVSEPDAFSYAYLAWVLSDQAIAEAWLAPSLDGLDEIPYEILFLSFLISFKLSI